MVDSVDDEQYAKFANSVRQEFYDIHACLVMMNMMWTVETGDTVFNIILLAVSTRPLDGVLLAAAPLAARRLRRLPSLALASLL